MADELKSKTEVTPLLMLKTNHDSKHEITQNQNNEAKIKISDKNISRHPRKRVYVLMLCATAHFLSGVAFSLLGPFFPLEAAKKGMSVTLAGFVFGLFNLVIFITSPIIGSYLTAIGPRFVYLSGIFVGGSATILFGTLDKCPHGMPFIVTSLLCRAVGAFGFSAYTTSSFAIVSNTYSDKVATAFGVMETGIGLGFMVGPAIGGVLYDAGGFELPFYFTGGLTLLNGILIFFVMPVQEYVSKERKKSIFSLLGKPVVFIPMISILVAFLGISTFDSTFAKHVSYFGLSTSLVSLFFMIPSTIIACMATFWGHLSDKKDIQAPLVICGHLVYSLGFFIIGPSPLLPFVPYELWVMAVGPVFIGLSFGSMLIPTMKRMIKGALELGFENNIHTYSLVSGLFNFGNCCGGFLGPIVGGAILDAAGYPLLYTIVGAVSFLWMLVSLVFYPIHHYKRKRRKEEADSETPNGSKETVHTTPNPDDDDNVDDTTTDTIRRLSFHRSLTSSITITDTDF